MRLRQIQFLFTARQFGIGFFKSGGALFYAAVEIFIAALQGFFRAPPAGGDGAHQQRHHECERDAEASDPPGL